MGYVFFMLNICSSGDATTLISNELILNRFLEHASFYITIDVYNCDLLTLVGRESSVYVGENNL